MRVGAKLDAETPFWKWPAWWWVRRFGAWPFSVEALSAVFDFNRAPFFQSFVEVRVERSRAAGGVCGDRRRWSAALARSAGRRERWCRPGRAERRPVEFVLPLRQLGRTPVDLFQLTRPITDGHILSNRKINRPFKFLVWPQRERTNWAVFGLYHACSTRKARLFSLLDIQMRRVNPSRFRVWPPAAPRARSIAASC